MTTPDDIAGELAQAIDNLTELCDDIGGISFGAASVTGFVLVPHQYAEQLVAGSLARAYAGYLVRAFAILHHSQLPQPNWWRSELGQLVFAAHPFHDHEQVDFQTAAGILKITRQRVAQYVSGGRLKRTLQRGILCSSLYELWTARRTEEEQAA